MDEAGIDFLDTHLSFRLILRTSTTNSMADKYPGGLKRTEYAAFVVFNDQIKLQLYQNTKIELAADLFFKLRPLVALSACVCYFILKLLLDQQRLVFHTKPVKQPGLFCSSGFSFPLTAY